MSAIVDLTLTYTDSFTGFTKETSKTIDKDGWNASTLNFYSHCGTHMDAPIHFNVSDQTIDKIPVSDFVGKAWVIDVRDVGSILLLQLEVFVFPPTVLVTDSEAFVFYLVERLSRPCATNVGLSE